MAYCVVLWPLDSCLGSFPGWVDPQSLLFPTCPVFLILNTKKRGYLKKGITCSNYFVGEALQKHEMVGAFQKLPMVMPSIDILSSAQRKARKVTPTKGNISPWCFLLHIQIILLSIADILFYSRYLVICCFMSKVLQTSQSEREIEGQSNLMH